jgi:YcaO-like protein with predicted kinase domain
VRLGSAALRKRASPARRRVDDEGRDFDLSGRTGAGLKAYWLGTHRSEEPSATLHKLAPKLAAMGVTRVANITGLDYLGIPVAVACRPAARSLSVQQGKGLTLPAAKVAAIMESAESYSAQRVRSSDVVGPAIGFAKDTYILPRHLLQRPVGTRTVLPWCEGYDLLQKRQVFVPQELVTLDAAWPRPQHYDYFISNSKGLACGNTHEEALLHALCELIERDAYSLWRQLPDSSRAATLIDPGAVDDPPVRDLVERYDRAGIQVTCWEITSDIAVPCFFCVIDDRRGRPPFLGRFVGLGCHPSVTVSLCRALTEAAQSRLTLIVGTREDILPDHYAGISWHRNYISLLTMEVRDLRYGPIRATSFDTDHFSDDIKAVLARLGQAEVRSVVSVDLMCPELQIPCVRVVSPDLEGAHQQGGYKMGRRARKLALGWS